MSLFRYYAGEALQPTGEMHPSSAEPPAPFGGFKQSSSGAREQGKAARESFTQVKTVYLDPP